MRGATGVDGALPGLRDAVADRARPAEDGDAVAGVVPRYVVRPTSTAETAAVMAVAAAHDLCVVARGAGTKQDWGVPPRRVDLVVDTTGLTGVVEHVAGDLVCVVRAGTPVESLQAVLAEAGQQLALDLPLPGATLGGTVAVSTSGPRRLLYGTMRDLLIGVTFVRADGIVASAGGKVVKNVAGYDFGKLLTGSYGTLGVVTEAVVRLHPRPVAQRVVRCPVAGPADAGRLAAAVLGSQLVPSAVEVEQRGDGPVAVTVLLEGIESGVDLRAAGTRDLLGADAAVDDRLPPGFTDLPFGAGGTGLKVTSTITGVAAVLESLRRAGTRQGVEVAVRGSAMGVLHAGLPAGTPPGAVAAVVEAVRAVAREHDGSAVVLTAPPDVRAEVDVWGPVPGLDLMRRVKDELDPGHRLAPGRFVGGI
ncbi:MAG TPA: FAD-binding oxidoreductase [Actinomycetes bacterium]|nr:FAD-binding oxidoreductase [Actinomycetes bacterium]